VTFRPKSDVAGSRSSDDLVIPAIADDGSLFPIDKLEAHRRGQKHLAVSVFVFAGDKLLLQQRADGKYHCGGLWANTCCTHPHWDEPTLACAHRRLQEEVGFKLALKPGAIVEYRADVGNGLVENELVHTFHGELPAPEEIATFNPSEVQAVAWIGQAELRRKVADRPGRFTPWLRIYLERWSELALRPAA
jgi:isopentenyl-diphosphate Delta-isomerase